MVLKSPARIKQITDDLPLRITIVIVSQTGETSNGSRDELWRWGENFSLRSRNNYLLQYILKANYDQQEMRYPGEPLKTLLAMLFQVSWQKTSEIFFRIGENNYSNGWKKYCVPSQYFRCLAWWQRQLLWSLPMRASQILQRINHFRTGCDIINCLLYIILNISLL